MKNVRFHCRLPLAKAACAIALVFAASGPALAEQPNSARIADLERKLERSLMLIEGLTAKVKQLETAGTPKSVAPADSGELSATVAKQSARIEGIELQVSQFGAGMGSRFGANEGVSLHGFADVSAGWNSKGDPKGFNVGSLGFYLTPQFGANVKSLVELVFEFDAEGHLATDLERVQLGYTFSDAATVWMGRFHTPYGYWNTGYHHGKQIQTSLNRPQFINFEDRGGILPSHTVGVWGAGAIRMGDGKLSYDLFLGNSPKISSNVLNMNNSGTTRQNMMAGVNLGYGFSGNLEGLKLGAHGLRGTVNDDVAPFNTTTLNMLGGYAVYDRDDWEGLAEYYHFNNKDVSGGTGSHRSWASFVQLGRNMGSWTPYGRFEKTRLDQKDNYFSQQAAGFSYTRQVLGLRYDLDPKAAVTLEVNRTRVADRAPESYNEAQVQYAIRF